MKRLLLILLLACVPGRVWGAWASASDLGVAADKVAGTSITMTNANTVEVNNVILVVVAVDNASASDGDNNEVTGVVDGASNTYVQAREFTNAQTGAATGATVAVFFSKVTTQLSASSTITANLSSSITAKAISAWEFTITSTNVVTVEAGTDEAADGADLGSLDLSVANAEYLWVRGAARESSTVANITATTNFSTISRATTGGGASATNMGVRGERRIFTGTSNASNPTSESVDHASVYVALKESVAAANATPIRRPIVLQ